MYINREEEKKGEERKEEEEERESKKEREREGKKNKRGGDKGKSKITLSSALLYLHAGGECAGGECGIRQRRFQAASWLPQFFACSGRDSLFPGAPIRSVPKHTVPN